MFAPFVHEGFSPAATSVRPPLASRFTLDGSDDLEQQLTDICQFVQKKIRQIVPASQLEGLLLGGGYGRGEGGVLKTKTGDRAYNDLEFYVFVRGHNWVNEWRFGKLLHGLSENLSPQAGVEVEFKIISAAKLRRSPPSMFYYDLVMGHRQLWGSENLLAGCDHLRHGGAIPLSEATRLMMNRCSGLLFAQEKLAGKNFTPEDADFVGRNLAKAQLGFGDAVLTALGQYHWSCLERYDRLRNPALAKNFRWFSDVRRHHQTGIKFKLHPHCSPPDRDLLQKQFEELAALGSQVWLWLESKRLGRKFVSQNDYALCSLNKCPETQPWRNWLMNAKISRARIFFQRAAFRHPRERLLNRLALLLWERRATFAGEPAVDNYRKLWRQLN